jgi:hypothetical protein
MTDSVDGEKAHPATEANHPPTDEVVWERTATATGGPWPAGSTPPRGQAWSPDSGEPPPGRSSAEVRFGPGVPGAAPSGQPAVSAEEVWRTGQLPGPPPRRGRWRRQAGTALTVALLIACGVVIYLRLHHAPFAVTGVAITAQVKNGCAVDVTGRIGTSGGAGSVSYQWVLTPQAAAPRPLSQSVTAGQSAVYVTISDQGSGQGRQAQQITLEVLGPGQGRASTHVVISC